MSNVNIKIHNYKFSEKQGKEIQHKLEFLLKQIPYSSFVTLDFDYREKTFYGKIKVDCYGKVFFAKNTDKLLSSLTTSLCKKIQKQVMKWKKTRTVEEITGIIAFAPSKASPLLDDSNLYKKAG